MMEQEKVKNIPEINIDVPKNKVKNRRIRRKADHTQKGAILPDVIHLGNQLTTSNNIVTHSHQICVYTLGPKGPCVDTHKCINIILLYFTTYIKQ